MLLTDEKYTAGRTDHPKMGMPSKEEGKDDDEGRTDQPSK